jgi:hypothetical protein
LYLSGFFAAFFILAGFLFKIMHWPGATVMLTFGDTMLVVAMTGLLVQCLRYRASMAATTFARILSGSIGGWVFGLGAFFKLMWWPGGNIMIILGVFTLLFAFLPLFFLELYRKEMRSAVK